jgi:parallel beta-helix repeat protein
MNKANKSISISFLAIGLSLIFLAGGLFAEAANENYGNLPRDLNMMFMMAQESIELPFNSNDYAFLIYVPEGQQDSIVAAMEKILDRDIDPSEIRKWNNEVTLEDLATHDILIVGWNANGNVSGLDDDILSAGITGRVILSGHDADYHTVHGPPEAEVFLVQAIDYVLASVGTGMITLGCTDEFPYLPEEWDVTPDYLYYGGEDVDEFTEEGLASGVYDGLTPDEMSDWYTSYHDVFTIGQDSDFVPFELGGDGDYFISVARIFSSYGGVDLTKIDDVDEEDCVEPDDYITYTISYDLGDENHDYVVITDHLPIEVNFDSCSDDGDYIESEHTVEWQIDPSPTQGSVTLTVQVNELAVPEENLRNFCEIESDIAYKSDEEDTDVCCWNPGVIYVDEDATGLNTGMSWEHAYTNLQDALEKVRNCYANEIWVAEGTYRPAEAPDWEWEDTFELVDGVAIKGGYAGFGQPNPDARDTEVYETILSGDIDGNGSSDVNDVVTASNVGQTTIIDGFIIRKGILSGVWCDTNGSPTISYNTIKENNYDGVDCGDTSDPTIIACTIEDNDRHGIKCLPGSSLTIIESTVQNNTQNGIYAENSEITVSNNCSFKDHSGENSNGIYGSGVNLTVEDSTFVNNYIGIKVENSSDLTIVDTILSGSTINAVHTSNGSNLTLLNSMVSYSGKDSLNLNDNSTTIIKNNWIHHNGTDEEYYGAGIWLNEPVSVPVIRNNTICNNFTYGIEESEQGADPEILNCIIYGNDEGDLYRWSGTFNNVKYCCLQNPHDGTENITVDPSFVSGTDDYHLSFSSPCIHAGDPDYQPDGETDIDGESRVAGLRVEIGADEIASYPEGCQPDYDEWILMDKPDCWLNPRQCQGDADGLKEGSAKKGYYYVHFDDLNVLLAGWNTLEPPDGPGIATITGPNGEPGICADFAHDKEGSSKKGYWRVHFNDLNILIANWNTLEPDKGLGVPPDCLDCQRGQQAKGGELSIEEIMKWIEEIWLDPEARKVIDEDAWLKFIESLAEEVQKKQI